jgi:RNA polymerase sigma-70 factor (ECF subfamily)
MDVPTSEHRLAMRQLPDEQELLAKAVQGDQEAVALLYERHVDAIFAYLRYRVDSDLVAEDLTSEVFLRMVRGLSGFQDRGLPFRAWLYRIAANLLTDHYRQRGKTADIAITEAYESDDTDPLDSIARDDEQLRLSLAMKQLSPDHQELLILRFIEGLPHAEIAQIMNRSAEALRAMQHRALKALAERLENLGGRQL